MLARLARRLGARLGLQPRPSWEQELSHTLRTLSVERGTTVDDIIARVEVEPVLLQQVSASLTVNETFFFREMRHFEVAVAHIVSRAENGTVTVWSAGCSSGEEPYSLAILLARKAPYIHSSRVQIRANDISGAALGKAHRGVYGAWSFRSTPQWLRAEYFETLGANEWKLDACIRERVQFLEGTIQTILPRTPAGSIDVLFFRNVSIYAEPAALVSIFHDFHRVLKSDGLLIQSVSDVLPPPELFNLVPSPVLGVYSPQKNRVAARESSSPRPSSDDTYHDFAIETLRKVRSVPPVATLEEPSKPIEKANDAPNMLRAAIDWANSGNFDRAFEHLDRLLAASPENIEARFLRGKLLVANRSSQEAVNEFRKVVFLAPGHRLARYWLATTLISIALPRKAMLEFTELSRRLANVDATDVLEDGETRAEELIAAIDVQQRTLQ